MAGAVAAVTGAAAGLSAAGASEADCGMMRRIGLICGGFQLNPLLPPVGEVGEEISGSVVGQLVVRIIWSELSDRVLVVFLLRTR